MRLVKGVREKPTQWTEIASVPIIDIMTNMYIRTKMKYIMTKSTLPTNFFICSFDGGEVSLWCGSAHYIDIETSSLNISPAANTSRSLSTPDSSSCTNLLEKSLKIKQHLSGKSERNIGLRLMALAHRILETSCTSDVISAASKVFSWFMFYGISIFYRSLHCCICRFSVASMFIPQTISDGASML